MLLDADQQRHEEVGEDTWELFEAIERSFDVALGDYFALAGIRVSELAEKISTLADYPTREKCISAVAFYRLRRALQEVCNVPARLIRPSTPIDDVLPWSKRREQWKQLEKTTGLDLPGLMGPRWLFLLCFILSLSILSAVKVTFVPQLGWMAVVIGSLFLFVTLLWLCLPLARSFPPTCKTIGDLTKLVLACNYARLSAHGAGSSTRYVEESLVQLISLSTGVIEISGRTRIPSDLNIY
jgi:hypothetical protein